MEINKPLAAAYYLKEELNIDATQIVITGYSVGGSAAWYYAFKYPHIVTAAIPVATKVQSNMDGFVQIPVYVINSIDDMNVPFEAVREWVGELQNLGMDITFMEVQGAIHSDIGGYVEGLSSAVAWLIEKWSN